MNEEHISALVDDEVDDEKAAAAVDTLLTDGSLRRVWGRYHLIGEALRAADDARFRPAPTSTFPARRVGATPALGFAIAASVAALALALVLMPGRDSGSGEFEIAASAEAPAAVAPAQVVSVPAASARGIAPVGTYDQRLNGYLVNFNEQRARLGVPGVHPYVRIVGFEAE